MLSKYCHSLIKIKILMLIWSKRRFNKYKRMNYCIRILSQQFYLGIHQVKKAAANNSIKSGRNHQELKRSSKNQNKH